VVHVDRAHRDTVLARVAHDLRRRVEAHRLAVEQGGGEDVGVVALHPARDVDEIGEARRVAFREAVFAEALDLLETACGEFARIAARAHAADELVAEFVDRAGALERRHGAAQSVRFDRGKFAATIAMRIACSWNRGMPSVSFRMLFSSSLSPCSGLGET
jgi:hypothetical protein